jgi:hypothetical protein
MPEDERIGVVGKASLGLYRGGGRISMVGVMLEEVGVDVKSKFRKGRGGLQEVKDQYHPCCGWRTRESTKGAWDKKN